MSKVLAIDLGYSSVKVCRVNDEGVLVFDKFVSAVAKLPSNAILDGTDIDNDTMFRLNGDTYTLGSSALKVPRSYLLNLETFEDMKQSYPVWCSFLFNRYGGVDKFDKVAIGLSMAFADKADELLAYLYESLMIDKPGFFMCLPQGLSCKLAYAECGLDIRETTKHNDQRMRSFLLADGGFLTLDLSLMRGANSASTAVGIENSGIICIACDLKQYLFKHMEMKASIKECAAILDNDGKFIRRGKSYDIKDKVDEFSKKYLINVLNLIEERFNESLDVAEGILVCGGLAYIFKKYINDPDLVKEIEKHFPVSYLQFPVTDSEFFNAYSYYRIANNMMNPDKNQ